jgi:hypothetical protein
MKISAAVLALVGVTQLAAAQQTISPTPAASPKVAPAPVFGGLNQLSEKDVREALDSLKRNFLHPEALSQSAIDRATLAGLLQQLRPGVLFEPRFEDWEKSGPGAYPLHSEIIGGKVGYLRVSWLLKGDLVPLDVALGEFARQSIGSLILDLRATRGQGDYEQAAAILSRFCPKGRELFDLKGGETKTRIFTSNQDPTYQGIIVVLVDRENGGASEVIAAVLRQQARALIVGEQTSGRAVEYSLVQFADLGKASQSVPLQIATAAVSIPQVTSIYPKGVTPDIVVKLSDDDSAALDSELASRQSVVPFITDIPIPRTSEHALVNGETPELDALEARQQNGPPKTFPKDIVLQRAVDLITSISVIDQKH